MPIRNVLSEKKTCAQVFVETEPVVSGTQCTRRSTHESRNANTTRRGE